MADQKSQHYNWFKGDSKGGKKKSSKESAKTVWKFTKIFLYFSLFFFSMWGCVQVFIVKTDTGVGRGVELYADQENISPQVISVHVDKKADNVYDIYQANDNVWVNPKEDGQTFDETIKNIKALTTAGDSFTLDQANKGGNAVARLVVDKQELTGHHKGLLTDVVYTTAAKDVTAEKANTIVGIDKLIYYTDPTDLTKQDVIDLTTIDSKTAGSQFSLNIAKQILGSTLGSAIKTELTTPVADAKLIDAHNNLVKSFANIIGAYKDDKSVWHLSDNAFGFKSNKYTPIATWGQAWDMHRGAGPFYGIFVYPISWVTNKIVDAFPMMAGWESLLAIVIVVVAISMIAFALSFKGTLQQTKMQELNAKKAVIDAKYAPYKGNKQMEMRQKQEVADLYKKEGINPMSSLVTIFVTMPFFFAMWRVIGGIQHLKGTTWLGMNFAATSYKELFAGHVQYLPLMILAAGIQLFSQIYPRLLTKRRDKNRMNVHQKAAMKKGNKMQNIMLVVFGFMALIFTAGLQVYFIVRSLWRLVEVQITHHILVHNRKARIRKATN